MLASTAPSDNAKHALHAPAHSKTYICIHWYSRHCNITLQECLNILHVCTFRYIYWTKVIEGYCLPAVPGDADTGAVSREQRDESRPAGVTSVQGHITDSLTRTSETTLAAFCDMRNTLKVLMLKIDRSPTEWKSHATDPLSSPQCHVPCNVVNSDGFWFVVSVSIVHQISLKVIPTISFACRRYSIVVWTPQFLKLLKLY